MNKINTDVNYKTMAGNARLVMLGESSHSTAGYKYEAIKAIKYWNENSRARRVS